MKTDVGFIFSFNQLTELTFSYPKSKKAKTSNTTTT